VYCPDCTNVEMRVVFVYVMKGPRGDYDLLTFYQCMKCKRIEVDID